MYFVYCLFLILLDQIIKFLCVKNLNPVNSITIIKNFFNLTYVENRGAAFGILEGSKFFFILIAALAIFACIFYFRQNIYPLNKLYKTSLILIISGAIGNLIDRLFRGFVVDMFHFIFFKKDFAVFNCADVYIVLGVFTLVLVLLYNDFYNKKRL